MQKKQQKIITCEMVVKVLEIACFIAFSALFTNYVRMVVLNAWSACM